MSQLTPLNRALTPLYRLGIARSRDLAGAGVSRPVPREAERPFKAREADGLEDLALSRQLR